jgi:hypothetical protein
MVHPGMTIPKDVDRKDFFRTYIRPKIPVSRRIDHGCDGDSPVADPDTISRNIRVTVMRSF